MCPQNAEDYHLQQRNYAQWKLGGKDTNTTQISEFYKKRTRKGRRPKRSITCI